MFGLPYLAVCILAAFGMFHLKAKVLRINLIPNMLIWDNRKSDLHVFEVKVGVNEKWIVAIGDSEKRSIFYLSLKSFWLLHFGSYQKCTYSSEN